MNIYKDSKFVFVTVHVCGILCEECGFSTAEGKQIKNKDEISQLLTTIWKPKKVAIIQFKGNQKVKDTVTIGNHKADEVAKLTFEASFGGDNDLVQNLETQHEIPPKMVLNLHKGLLHYTEEEIKCAKQQGIM